MEKYLRIFGSLLGTACFAIIFSFNSLANELRDSIGFILDVEQIQDLQTTGKSDLLFVDVRSLKDYAKEHIEGAISLPAKHSFNELGDKTRIASLSQVRTYFSKAGIRNSDSVVIYDNGDLKNASHVFWIMETYGHAIVRVMNGGFPVWKKNKGSISTHATRREASDYTPVISPNHLSSMLTTRLAMKNPNASIVDARVESHFQGEKSAAKRFGHIPGALSIPSGNNFTVDGNTKTLKPFADLQQLYKNISPDKNVITYCNKGKESAISYLVMRHLGFNVSIYDGAWLEWGNENNTPVSNPHNSQSMINREGN